MKKKRIILMRHAQSPQSHDTKDHQRPLSQKGHKQAGEMGQFLKQKQWLPDRLLISTALRTRQTAEELIKSAGIDNEKIFPDVKLYAAVAQKIEESIRMGEIPDETNTLLVLAHNPGISQLAAHCAGDDKKLFFSPGTLAGFEWEGSHWDDFSTDNTELSFHHEPKRPY